MTRCGEAYPTGTAYPAPVPPPRRAAPAPAPASVSAPVPPMDPWADTPTGARVRWEPNARLAAKGRGPVVGTLRALGRGTSTRFARIATPDGVAQVWENQGALAVLGDVHSATSSPSPPAARPSPPAARARRASAAPATLPPAEAPPPAPTSEAPPGTDRNVFIVIKPPPEVAAKLAAHAKVAADELHVTLAFLGRERAIGPERMASLRRALASLAASRPAIVGETVPWTEVFPGGAQYTQVAGEAIAPLREAVVAASEGAGVPVDRTHPFVAHITLDRAVAEEARGRRLPPFVVPFLDLWLCVGRSSCEQFPLARPENAARVATAREVGLERGRALDAARGRNGWRGQRAAVGWLDKTKQSDETVARLERSYGMVPSAATRRLPSPTSMAPGLREPAPLPCAGQWAKDVCAALPKAVRAVETILPTLRDFPDATRAVAAVRRAVEKGAPCASERYTDDMLERDRGRASGLELVGLMAVWHLSNACRHEGELSTYTADAALRTAREAADFLRVRAASPPIDFAEALGSDGRRLGDNPTLSLAPDPTPRAAAARVVAFAAESRHGDTMVAGDQRDYLPEHPPTELAVWQEFRVDPFVARQRAEYALVQALGGVLQRARRVAASDRPDDRGYTSGQAVDALARLDAVRLFELAAEAGVREPAVAAYPVVVAKGRARRAEVERELADLGPRGAAALGELARAARAAAGAGVDAALADVAARPELRRSPAAAELAAVRAGLLRIADKLNESTSFTDAADLFEGTWLWYGREGTPAPMPESRGKYREPLEEILRARVTGPVRAAAARAIERSLPFARKLDALRAEHEALAEDSLLAGPWRALYGRHAPERPAYDNAFRTVESERERRRQRAEMEAST